MTESVSEINIQRDQDRKFYEQATKQFRYVWRDVGRHLGLGRDVLLRIDCENQDNKNFAWKSCRMLQIALERMSYRALRLKLNDWEIEESTLKDLANKLPLSAARELAELFQLCPTSNSETVINYINRTGGFRFGSFCLQKLNESLIVSEFSPNNANLLGQRKMIPNLNVNLHHLGCRESHWDEVAELRAELSMLRKNYQTLQETLDRLIVQIQYQAPPATNPQRGTAPGFFKTI